MVEIYTDGACSGNPGPGGWGVLWRMGDHEKQRHGGDPDTTNNRMELMAAIVGLEALRKPCQVVLVTDSQYVRQGITQWLPGGKRKNWLTANRTPVRNKDLWQRLEAAADPHSIEWKWVRGHSGHKDNETVDALARQGALEAARGTGTGTQTGTV